MKKTKLKEVMPFFPLTIQNAEIIKREGRTAEMMLFGRNYQSDRVNSQQFYKPISKIIRFQ